MKNTILTILCLTISLSLFSQFTIDVSQSHFCQLSHLEVNDQIEIVMPSPYANDFVNNLVLRSGLSKNFNLVQSNVIKKAWALIDEEGDRYLIYNEQFIQSLENSTSVNWPVLFTFAHELGHHLMNHPLDQNLSMKKRHENELAADKYAGFLLYNMGASMKNALLITEEFKSNETNTHPKKLDRVQAIIDGWNQGEHACQPYNSGSIKKPCNSKKGNITFINKTKQPLFINVKKNEVSTERHFKKVHPNDKVTIELNSAKVYLYNTSIPMGDKSTMGYPYTNGQFEIRPCQTEVIHIK